MQQRNKKVVAEALKFIAGFLLFLALAYLLVFLTPLNYALKTTAAYSTQVLLSAAGKETTLVFPGNDPRLVASNFDAEFADLCGGGLELAVLVAVILATWDRSWRQRFSGAALGVFVLLALNALRIAVTLLLFNAQQASLSELFHGVLFKFSLIAIIVGYYYVWYVKLSPHWKK